MSAPDALDAERALLGAVLVRPDLLGDCAHLVAAGDFYKPSHGTAWAAVCEAWGQGDPLDSVSLSSRLPELAKADIAAWLAEWSGGRPGRLVDAIVTARARRDLLAAGAELVQAGQNQALDPFDVRDTAQAALGGVSAPAAVPEGLCTLDEFLARPRKLHEWVVPGLVGEDWRALIVAAEGMGKMWLLRQVCIAAAAGVHPLQFGRTRPVRVLMVDLENPEQQVRQSTQRMIREAQRNGEWDPDRCWLWHEPGGIDIRTRRDRSRLEGVLRETRPDLVAVGPLYKLSRQGKDSMEDAAHETQQALDDMRTRHRFALLIEHHAPKPQGGVRDILPFGSSLWLRWPELGIKLIGAKDAPKGSLDVKRWKPDRLPCAWPDRIDRTPGWPWTGRWNDTYNAAMDDLARSS